MTTVYKVLGDGLLGGTFTLLFALISAIMSPKRLAGLFTGAPSVALGGMTITAAMLGTADVGLNAEGMIGGAVGLAVTAAIASRAITRWGLWRGVGAASAGWLAVGGVTYAVLQGMF